MVKSWQAGIFLALLPAGWSARENETADLWLRLRELGRYRLDKCLAKGTPDNLHAFSFSALYFVWIEEESPFLFGAVSDSRILMPARVVRYHLAKWLPS